MPGTRRRQLKVVAFLAACTVALVVAVSTPAHALTVGDRPNWRDFPELRQGLYWNSNLVKLWQRIVQADVDTGRTCEQFVDGQFGSNTYSRTRTWQSSFGIGVDGKVGPQTWGTAQGHLSFDYTNSRFYDGTVNGYGEKIWYQNYYYVGRRSSFYLSFIIHEQWVDGSYQRTFYEPWQFHSCQGYWITVSW